ncbi:MAG: hypothetical protein AAFO85_13975 [Cyanobacteria bacterium J06598_4]
MIEENKIFRTIWRFNALIIMATGLLAVSLLSFGLIATIGKEFRRSATKINSTQINPLEVPPEPLVSGKYHRVEGTPYLIFPLHDRDAYSKSIYGQRSPVGDRNYLFVNSRTNAKRWLLPNNEQIISNRYPVRDRSIKNAPTLALLYVLQSREKVKSEQDNLVEIGISKVDGDQYESIISNVRYLGHERINSSQIVVFYRQDEQIYSQIVMLDNPESWILAKPTLIYS